MGAPINTLVSPVGPGFDRPKHKRTATGLGPTEIKSVEASIPEHQREAYVLSKPVEPKKLAELRKLI